MVMMEVEIEIGDWKLEVRLDGDYGDLNRIMREI